MNCLQRFKIQKRYKNIDERYGKAEIEEEHRITGSMYPEHICFDGKERRTARQSELIEIILLINN